MKRVGIITTRGDSDGEEQVSDGSESSNDEEISRKASQQSIKRRRTDDEERVPTTYVISRGFDRPSRHYLSCNIFQYGYMSSFEDMLCSSPFETLDKWCKEYRRYIPTGLVITNQDKGMSIVDMMKEQVDSYPNSELWLCDVKELILRQCRITDDWKWLIRKLPNLEKLTVEVSRIKQTLRKKLTIPSSSLVASLGNQLHTISFDGFNYATNETDIVENLIKMSHLSHTGLRNIQFKSYVFTKPFVPRFICDSLPLQEICKMIEEAKFDSAVEITFDYHYDNGEPVEFIDWMLSKNLLHHVIEQEDHQFWKAYQFIYRDSLFKVVIIKQLIIGFRQ